ncbi:unnamed protein product [Dibothriocephalus latus]|uniref:Uncharacterized protein n=1 Tax=Dibothriocephalus latus TaxID=60516 RepID=A0A3P6TAW1_DIBLA|nr:unnamed protein product [Dibothriocephalus latus]
MGRGTYTAVLSMNVPENDPFFKIWLASVKDSESTSKIILNGKHVHVKGGHEGFVRIMPPYDHRFLELQHHNSTMKLNEGFTGTKGIVITSLDREERYSFTLADVSCERISGSTDAAIHPLPVNYYAWFLLAAKAATGCVSLGAFSARSLFPPSKVRLAVAEFYSQKIKINLKLPFADGSRWCVDGKRVCYITYADLDKYLSHFQTRFQDEDYDVDNDVVVVVVVDDDDDDDHDDDHGATSSPIEMSRRSSGK